ncbi:PIN domain-containing protein [Flavobacterium sp.]
MDHIFLDTSIFINENFLQGKKINSLLSLSEKGKIELYITEITYNELKSNFKKFLSIAFTNHNRFKKDKENRILQNDSGLQNLFVKIDTEKINNDFILKLDNLIRDSTIKIIPYKSLDIRVVFDKYFEPEPPFGKGDKKSEFPDAFTLELIEDFCKDNKIIGIVFSSDNDLLFSKFPHLDIRKNYSDYLEIKYTEMALVKKKIAEEIFLLNKVNIERSFVEWYKDNLGDISLYFDAVNWKEVYDVDIEEIKVGSLEYTIIEIADDIVTIEITAPVEVKVNVLTDDENFMYYDSDDKSYHYLETSYVSVENEFDSSMIVYAEIIDENEYLEDFTIESINENKDISFPNNYDY